ncbi:hypothetical protein MICAE_420002 [Microcystis aeruginosa PCC 9806]|uniref:Uncharacterized protein n=1 Tax=Microcystis aeruginosa PCC 9806 TaxID=1160282 RepID=I4GYI7_MICAE|nr:hypothetical protein MICAE_420002 [Microcystis aeruginosa PCC 9806]
MSPIIPVSYQLSVISDQLSVISYQLSKALVSLSSNIQLQPFS